MSIEPRLVRPEDIESNRTTIDVTPPDLSALRAEVDPLLARIAHEAITDQTALEFHEEYLNLVKGYAKQLDGLCDPVIRTAYEAYKALQEAKKEFAERLKEAEALLKRRIAAWIEQQREKARQEQLRLERAAREAEERRREAEAKALAEAGRTEEAKRLAEAPIVAAPIVAPQPAAELRSGSTTTVWRYRIVDRDAIPDEYWVVDEKRLAAVVKALKGTKPIPGIEQYPETQVSYRAH